MSAVRRTLRAALLALGFAFAIGFGIGSWLRCQMQRPPTYIGGADAPRVDRSPS